MAIQSYPNPNYEFNARLGIFVLRKSEVPEGDFSGEISRVPSAVIAEKTLEDSKKWYSVQNPFWND